MNVATQSAINTVNGWRAQRRAKGKPVDTAATAAYIRTTWPTMTEDEVAEIMKELKD